MNADFSYLRDQLCDSVRKAIDEVLPADLSAEARQRVLFIALCDVEPTVHRMVRDVRDTLERLEEMGKI